MKKLPILTFILVIFTTTGYAQRYNRYGNDDYTKFRVGLQGGWSYLIAPISSNVPPDFYQYMKELKSGYHFGADGTFYFTRVIGVGIKYVTFRTANETGPIQAYNIATNEVKTGMLKDDITIHFIGPTFNTRVMFAEDRVHFISYASIGYQAYKNNATIVDDFTLSSGTLGLSLGTGFDFAITRNFALGIGFSLITGVLDHYKYQDANETRTIQLEENEYEGISRIDVSAGLRVNL